MRYVVLSSIVAINLLAAGGDLVLAARGKTSDYAIVAPEQSAENVAYAAKELQQWVNRLTGADLAIVPGLPTNSCKQTKAIRLAAVSDPELGDDGFELKAESNGCLLVKGGRRGLLYGVYELLERFGGIMWLSPDFTHLPKMDRLVVPSDLADRQKPAFPARHHDTFNCWGIPEFAARSRLNESTAHMRFGSWFPPHDRVLGKCHTFHRLVPPETYYATHPEYYSLVKGKRLKVQPQLCLTNPDVFRIALSNVLARIAANKSDPREWRRLTKYYGVSQDDWNNYCECPNCAAIDAREESHAGCVIWFLNKLAEEVEKAHPDVMLSTLAYMYSRKPPKYLRPRHNVAICLCTIECDFSKPMTVNRYQENIDFKENVLNWRGMTKDLFLWDYAANWRATPTPYPNLSAMAANIRFYRDAGAQHLFEEGISSPSASFTDLKGWVGAKLMWNPDQPHEPLLTRFCEAYYGKAAPHVLAFIRLMEAQPIDETKTPITYAVPVEKMPFTTEFYEKGTTLWRQAEIAVAGEDPKIVEHVAWGKFGLDYTRAALFAQTGFWRPVIASRRAVAQLDRKLFLEMRDLARACRARLNAHPGAMVSSRLNDARLKGYIHALAQSELPSTEGPLAAVLQDWALSYSDHPKSTTIFRVDDKDATDGRALSVTKDGGDWKITCQLAQTVALDEGTTYRVRARLKVRKEDGAKPKVGLLALGIFDRATRKDVVRAPVFAEKATGNYAWYDLGSFAHEGHELILHIDPRDAVFSVDCVEFAEEK